MAWESRNGVGHYYTRSKRVNGWVVREYVGTGLIGELAAAEDVKRRAEKVKRRQAWQACKDDLERVSALVDHCTERITALTAAVLLNAGFHRHHRGEWRKRRGG